MNLALVHDWIITMGGAERVLKELHQMWPEAPIYTLLADPRTVQEHFPDATIHTSGLQKIPGALRMYPVLAPLMPSAIESFDLSDFDTVLSSSVLFAKGIIVRPGTRHLSYCYSPSRMLWDRSASYERRGIMSRGVRHALRLWDTSAAKRPDRIASISRTTAERVKTYYRRDSVVVYPSVGASSHSLSPRTPGEHYLAVGRLVPHKNLDMLVDTCNKLRYPLVIIGDGPLRRQLRGRAEGHITFLGEIPDHERDRWYAGARALIVPNEEDFGLTAVEAMAQGTPVLALRRGGAVETVVEGTTGEFYDDAIPEALADGIRRINERVGEYDRQQIATHAQQWSRERFQNDMREFIS